MMWIGIVDDTFIDWMRLPAIYLTAYDAWNARETINKWYICKGCKCVKYCSRKCQKISWNKYNHDKQCKIIQQNYKQYF